MHIPSRKFFQSTLIEQIQGCVGTFFSFVLYVSHPKLNRIGAANYFLFIRKIFFFLKETNTNEFYKIPDISHLSLQNRKERQQLTMWIWSLCPSEDALTSISMNTRISKPSVHLTCMLMHLCYSHAFFQHISFLCSTFFLYYAYSYVYAYTWACINDISNITFSMCALMSLLKEACNLAGYTRPDWSTLKKGPDKTNNNILMELTD